MQSSTILSFALVRPLRFPVSGHTHTLRRSPLVSTASSNVTPTPPIPLHHAIKTAPQEPGVYRFLDNQNNPLYIGKARHLRTRLRNYLTSSGSPAATNPRMAAMLADACSMDFVLTSSEAAALALEATLVAEHRPPYNVLLKDDRRHPYALITFSEQYPRIIVSRTRRARPGDRIYGPFVEENKLRSLLYVIHTVFPLRQRKRPLFTDRPCINYDLGRCPGVCQKLVTPQQYSDTIAKVDKLLTGRVEEVLAEMRDTMQRHSDTMEYEQAASERDKIASLERVFYSNPHADGHFVDDTIAAASLVTQDSFAIRDIFAIAVSATNAKAVLFQMRGGKVISRLVFSVVVNGQSKGELLSAVVSSHYAGASHPMEIPEEVMMCTSIPDSQVLRRVLSEKRGKAVSIRGTRGTSNLAKIAQKNAEMELAVETRLVEHVARDLQILTDTLKPYCACLGNVSAGVVPERPNAKPLRQTTGESCDYNLSRIECYDISHTSGSNAVGSMAVFVDGAPAPKEYRRYNLNEEFSRQGHPDDFESIRETLRRRLKHLAAEGQTSHVGSQVLPNLIVIDGGKGQLSAAIGVLQELGLTDKISVISIAKGEEAIFVDGYSDPINYDADTDSCILNDGLRLICRIRDEAHRTAITAHRKRRGKQALRSGLDSVPGLGTVKRATLLDHFKGSPEAISAATPAQLEIAPGIGRELARRIFHHFHDTTKTITEVR